ncbi:hypothetical protein HHI36_019557 [Cryptolaemus montrouzieri]|uniref:Uncharacterized protein n=1 Tax=Cryptolaemus montrouzieri TaxID=559131 RepID=A0ABD2N7K5_9CUCU
MFCWTLLIPTMTLLVLHPLSSCSRITVFIIPRSILIFLCRQHGVLILLSKRISLIFTREITGGLLSYCEWNFDIEVSVSKFYDNVYEGLNRFVPMKPSRSSKYPRWYSGELINLISSKKGLIKNLNFLEIP